MIKPKCRSGQNRCFGQVLPLNYFILWSTFHLLLVGGDRHPSVAEAEWSPRSLFHILHCAWTRSLPYVKYTNRRRWLCCRGIIYVCMKKGERKEERAMTSRVLNLEPTLLGF